MILREQHVSIGSDEGVISVQGGRGTPWGQSTLIEVHEAGAFADVGEGNHLWIITAHQWGPFNVTARVLDNTPGALESWWEDVSEVSLDCSTSLYLTELVDEGLGVTLDMVPGSYRVRVSARGRASDWWEREQERPEDQGTSTRSAVEHYLIEAWLAPATPPEVVRESSTFALATRRL